MTWTHGKHTFRFGGEYLYENRLEINTYETFTSSATQTCPTNASGLFACGSNRATRWHPCCSTCRPALTVNVPQYEEVHVRMAPVGFFVQDEWHVRPNLTVDVGLRYDYDPAVKILDEQRRDRQRARICPAGNSSSDRAQTSAYTTGCSSPQLPPCVPGGLTSANPAFTVTVGGVTYNTLNNIVFSPNPAGAQVDQRQHRPAHRHRLGIRAQHRSARRLRHLLRPHRLSQPVRREYAAGFHLALDARRLRHAQYRAHGDVRHPHCCAHLQQPRHLRPLRRLRALRSLPVSPAAIRSLSRLRPGAPPSAATPTIPNYSDPAVAAVELPDRAAIVRQQHGVRRLRGKPHAAPGMVLQGQLPAGRPLLPEQSGARDSRAPTTPLTPAQINQQRIHAVRGAGLELFDVHRFFHFQCAGGAVPEALLARTRNPGGIHLGEVPGRFQWRLQRRERLRGRSLSNTSSTLTCRRASAPTTSRRCSP